MVSRGYREEDIMNRYSIRKIMLLVKIGHDNVNEMLKAVGKEVGIASRMAAGATKEEFSKWLRG